MEEAYLEDRMELSAKNKIVLLIVAVICVLYLNYEASVRGDLLSGSRSALINFSIALAIGILFLIIMMNLGGQRLQVTDKGVEISGLVRGARFSYSEIEKIEPATLIYPARSSWTWVGLVWTESDEKYYPDFVYDARDKNKLISFTTEGVSIKLKNGKRGFITIDNNSQLTSLIRKGMGR